MDVYTLRWPRWLRLPDARNRSGDQIDRLIRTIAIAIALVALPIALSVGASVYKAHSEMYALQAQTRSNITATVTGDTATPDLRRGSARVGVEWYSAGMQHTGTVRVPSAVKPGDSVPIWVDENGALVPAPKSATTALLDAIVVGIATWVVAAAITAAAAVWIRAFHMWLRQEAWQRDLDRLLGTD
ncbi:hypothetical protein CQY20_18870 [Mycolicibacterium agri]|nr:hypothetical protein CQY20_18870 [Mycolicibacterium agri]